jgi:hypothetical protein
MPRGTVRSMGFMARHSPFLGAYRRNPSSTTARAGRSRACVLARGSTYDQVRLRPSLSGALRSRLGRRSLERRQVCRLAMHFSDRLLAATQHKLGKIGEQRWPRGKPQVGRTAAQAITGSKSRHRSDKTQLPAHELVEHAFRYIGVRDIEHTSRHGLFSSRHIV